MVKMNRKGLKRCQNQIMNNICIVPIFFLMYGMYGLLFKSGRESIKRRRKKGDYKNEDPLGTYVFIAKSTDWHSVIKKSYK